MEFIRILFDELIEDNKNTNTMTPYHIINNDNKSKYEVCQEYDEFFKSRENSYIHELFYFQTISTYTCFCGYKSYTCENLLEIPLIFNKKIESIGLKELLNNYFKKIKILWEYKCWDCKKKKKKHTKSIRLYNVNDYFIITLQRYENDSLQINNSEVSFESSLNLGSYLDSNLFKGKGDFSLKVTIHYIENINSGHYFCFIKIEDEWFKFSDCNVEKISEMKFYSDSVYVLVYEKE